MSPLGRHLNVIFYNFRASFEKADNIWFYQLISFDKDASCSLNEEYERSFVDWNEHNANQNWPKVNDNFKEILAELRKKEGNALVDEFERILRVRIPKDVEDLRMAAHEKNVEAIQKKAHFLSTTLLTLQFQQGIHHSTNLENASKSGDLEEVLTLTNEFIEYLNRMLNEL